MMYYLKSISGQIYAINGADNLPAPQFMHGYTFVSHSDFLQWCADRHFTPEEMGDKAEG